jgi:glycosyltransferase involved in cell wall biosynthesis
MIGAPKVLHLVISLAHGGLERLVVEWTNERNRRHPGSTLICCLEETGELAKQVQGNAVFCVNAIRSKFPWDLLAVKRLKARMLQIALQTTDDGRQRAEEGKNTQQSIPKFEADAQLTTDDGQLTTGHALPFSPDHPNSCRLPLTALPSPVILHAHNLAAWQYAVIARFGTDAKVVHTWHGYGKGGVVNRLRRHVLARYTDILVAVSAQTADLMADVSWIPREKVVVVCNGVVEHVPSLEKDILQLRKTIGIPDGAFVVGSVGRLAHIKGHDRLIRAFADVVRTNEGRLASGDRRPTSEAERNNVQRSTFNTQLSRGEPHASDLAPSGPGSFTPTLRYSDTPILLLVGDGPERRNLELQAQEMGIAGHVVFAGLSNEPKKLLEVMDLFVLPSRGEGLPLALLEAMAAGVPVMATDVGGNREVMDDGNAGSILPDNENRWPAMFIEQMSEDGKRKCRQRVKIARERVRTGYSLDATLNGYENIYALLVGDPTL